jgi:PAS domain S-box-containing protein
MLKQRKKTRDIPIIFLTAAFKTEEFQKRGYDVGAADYLLKPIDDNQFLNKVSTYFRLIEKERSLNVILEQQVAERTAELNQTNQHLSNILANMGEALFVLTPAGAIKETNLAAQKLLAYSADELVGMQISDVFEEDGEEQAEAFFGTWLEALIRAGAVKDIDAALVDKQGKRIPILFSRTAITTESGELDEILCIAKNMQGYRKIDED